MKVAILGSNGMLGRDLMAACTKAGIEASGYDLPDVDITRNKGGLDKLGPCDWLINCAAYTNVDGAESHREEAFAVNGDGVRRVADWCSTNGSSLLHISTDYVFDGKGKLPYKEDDPVDPINTYGQSKLAGEMAVQSICQQYIIVRTQSLFGVRGRNFVQAVMGRLQEQGRPLRVVTDQVSCPTYTVHLAGAILRLLKTNQQGIVHVSAQGSCSWYEFACAIVDRVKPGTEIQRTVSAEYKSPALRPTYSVLDKSRYESLTGDKMPAWQVGLDQYLEELRSKQLG
jgi:dTDP-4-dehydrorhamnose reductase